MFAAMIYRKAVTLTEGLKAKEVEARYNAKREKIAQAESAAGKAQGDDCGAIDSGGKRGGIRAVGGAGLERGDVK